MFSISRQEHFKFSAAETACLSKALVKRAVGLSRDKDVDKEGANASHGAAPKRRFTHVQAPGNKVI